MEETRKQRLKQKDAREKARFNKHLYRMHGNSDNATGAPSHSSPQNYEISVHGIRFLVSKNGSKLVKIPGKRLKARGFRSQNASLPFGSRLTRHRGPQRRKGYPKDRISWRGQIL